MLTPASVGRLRNTLLWSAARLVHRRVGPPLCTAVHAAVGLVGVHRLPLDLALKHTYDYQVINLDPALIRRSVHVGEWARQDGVPARGTTRLRRWFGLGGGWKHLQRHVTRNIHGRFVAPGDWDLRQKPFEIRQTVIDLFVHGSRPQQTAEYLKMRHAVLSRQFAWTRGCRTVDDVDRYFADLIGLYEAIRADGYLTQSQLGNDGADEIRVCLDRHGRPCVFGGGTHRLSIAQLLRLPQVPVIVKRVHSEWVEQCLADHPADDTRGAIANGLAALEGEHPHEAARVERPLP